MQSTLASTTTRDEFRALAAEHRVVPVTRKLLADSETPLSAYRKLGANRPGTFGRKRPVLVAVVVHRRRGALGADRARRPRGMAGVSSGRGADRG